MIEKNEITLLAQGRVLKVSVCGGGGNHKRAKRTAVTLFSRSSRLRLLQKMASIKGKGLKSVFLTLTYGQEFPHPRAAKRHLDNFLKRIRRIYENVSGFWRLEFQERGAPHFHLLLFGLPFVSYSWFSETWGSVVERVFWDKSKEKIRAPFTRMEALKSHSHASRYVAKYVAKSGGGEGAGGFNVASYLTVEGNFLHPVTGENGGSVGRYWGVFNAEGLPLADMVEIVMNGYGRAAIDTLRRVLAATRWRIDPNGRYGFFLFEDNPYLWADYLEELIGVGA